MKRPAKLVTLAALLLALALPIASRADTIYSNLGAGPNDYCGCAGNGVNSGHQPAMAFTVPVGPGYDLTQVEIALAWNFGGTNSALVKLLNDSDGLPGGLIGSWFLGPFPNFDGSTTTIQPSQTIPGITGISLSGGTQYWLAAFPGDPSSDAAWYTTDPGSIGSVAHSFDGGSTWPLSSNNGGNSVRSAFAMYGDPVSDVPKVPGPGTLLLFGTGIAAYFARRRKPARS